MSPTPLDVGMGVTALALGLIFGSFANVCIHRLPEGESIVSPRSRCPSCRSPIRWYDNIPVLSWIGLGGRCRDCKTPIPWTYPLVEALVGALFLAAYLRFGLSLEAVTAAWISFAAVALTAIDLRHFLLPDALTLTGLAGALAIAIARGAGAAAGEGGGWAALLGGPFDEPVRLLAAIVGAAAGAAIPMAARGAYRLSRRLRGAAGNDPGRGVEGAGGTGDVREEEPRIGEQAQPDLHDSSQDGEPGGEEDDVAASALAEGMGLGDVKMLAMVGAFLGARMTFVTILIGSIAGCLIVLPWLLATGRGLKTPVPFGPFLALGSVVSALAGPPLAAAYGRLVQRVFFR